VTPEENKTILLTSAAHEIGDLLAAAGIESSEYSFAIVLWPVGEPEQCSSIFGCFDKEAAEEVPVALAAAFTRMKRPPRLVLVHKSPTPTKQ